MGWLSVDLFPSGSVIVIALLYLMLLGVAHYCLGIQTQALLDSTGVQLVGYQKGRFIRLG